MEGTQETARVPGLSHWLPMSEMGSSRCGPDWSESVDSYALGMLSQHPQGNRVHNSRERSEPDL